MAITNEQILLEQTFDLHYLNKFASLMTLGNGYLGVRASTEESYAEQVRGMYVAGIYNRATPHETSDLVNLPDLVGMRIELDGEIFSLLNGAILSYKRMLNLATGELTRDILWKNKEGKRFRLVFQRMAAKNNLHLLASKLTITSLDKPAKLKVETGIDAQQTNFGRQHLIEDTVRVFDEQIMLGVYRTTQSDHTIAIATSCHCSDESDITFSAKNRQLYTTIRHSLSVQTPYIVEKTGTIFTSLDQGETGKDIEAFSLRELKEQSSLGYGRLLENSAQVWKQFWQEKRVTVTSENNDDQLALDFAIYHIEIMTPSHDERFSVGAKGLTGEGYKGHVFWDTEIFITPFHLFSNPDTAKKLLSYRYLHLQQAMEKASLNGYKGALFPWESAFTGKEETPEFAAINIKTGKQQKVASALAEHHIVADIAYMVVEYYRHTADREFMKKQGLPLLKETARFWISRTTEENDQLFIKDVIGPDEYTEHIDNNAYTNYLAAYNVRQALTYMKLFDDCDEELIEQGEDFLKRLYLPKPNAEEIIPQDDTFLSKAEIDLTRYKEAQGSQAILLDYSRQEVNEMQILKQADVVMLLYLFPDLFSREVTAKNLEYYERHTIHDSSLSKAIHAIVAARCGEMETAYRFFKEACLIDLGPNPHSSDEGLHAASLGAIWLAAVFGFANLTCNDGGLVINPNLPDEWKKLVIPLTFKGSQLKVILTHDEINIVKMVGPELKMTINGKQYCISDKLSLESSKGDRDE